MSAEHGGFTGRRPFTPEDKKCTSCGGGLEPDTDGSGGSIDRCQKCGKPLQPRGVRASVSNTAPTKSDDNKRKPVRKATGKPARRLTVRAGKRGRKPGRRSGGLDGAALAIAAIERCSDKDLRRVLDALLEEVTSRAVATERERWSAWFEASPTADGTGRKTA